ncbi:MAG: T9SS type A sorting domain-containing protein [Janthinobacterium lividum]
MNLLLRSRRTAASLLFWLMLPLFSWAQVGLTGSVFEDPNYGGGAGRPFSGTSGTSGLSGATVELYSSVANGGTYLQTTTTNSSGTYTFAVAPSTTYQVRVVNKTVGSNRAGYSTYVVSASTPALIPVQTYAGTTSDANAGNRVGGVAPEKADTTANTSAALSDLTSTKATAQSVVSIAVGTSATTGPDFGFSFDVVVNSNNTRQGSLRQFITNANGLGGESSLSQSGYSLSTTSGTGTALVAGRETSIFMIPDGQAHAGQLAGLVSGLTSQSANPPAAPTASSPKVALIQVPTTTGGYTVVGTNATLTTVDGGTQTYNIGDTNQAVLGIGGTVGTTASLSYTSFSGPEVELVGVFNTTASTKPSGAVVIQADDFTLRNVAVRNFGNLGGQGAITVTSVPNRTGTLSGYSGGTGAQGAVRVVLENNVLGTDAASFTQPSAFTSAEGADGRNNQNIVLNGSGTNLTVKTLTVRTSLIGFSELRGIHIQGNTSITAAYNINLSIYDNVFEGAGVAGGPTGSKPPYQNSSAGAIELILLTTPYVEIYQNRITGPTDYLSYAATDDGGSDGIQINNAQVGSNKDANGVSQPYTSPQQVQSNRRDGGSVQTGSRIEQNTITKQRLAILCQSNLAFASYAIDGLLIKGNKFTGNVNGIYNQGASHQLQNNTLSSNAQRGITNIGPDVTFTGNTFDSNGLDGLLVGDATPATATKPTVTGVAVGLAGQGNTFSTNGTATNANGVGLAVVGANTRATITQNSFYGNGALAIDLSNTSNGHEGITANNGTLNAAFANQEVDYPILKTSTLTGTSLAVTGYVGSAPGQTTFGNLLVEFFVADNSPANQNGPLVVGDGKSISHGEGRTYLGSLTTDANGNFSGSFTIPSGAVLATGDLVASTVTIGSGATASTSEFSNNVRVNSIIPNTLTNVGLGNITGSTTLNPGLSATVNGPGNSVAYYTITSLAGLTSGTLSYNGQALTAANIATTQITNLALLTYTPVVTFTGSVSFTYTATDTEGVTSTTNQNGTTTSFGDATYTIPVINVADVTTTISGPTQLSAGQPTGTYTVTFTNVGNIPANATTRSVTLPSGATLTTAQTNAIVAQGGSVMGSTINFGNVGMLAAGASSTFTFSFQAPGTAGTATLTSTTSTTTTEGANRAPNTSSMALTVNPVTDVAAAITTLPAAGSTAASTSGVGFTATFTNNGPQTPAADMVYSVQLLAGLTAYGPVAASNGGSYDNTTGLVTYPNAATTLASGAPFTSVITFTAPPSGPVVAVARMSTTSDEAGQTANNTAPASLLITPTFDLTTTITGPASAVQDNEVTLNITTSNNGPSAAPTALQTVQLISGLTDVYVSNGGYYNSSTTPITVYVSAGSFAITGSGTAYQVPAGGVIFPPLSGLPSGQTVGNTISYRAPKAGVKLSPVATVTPNTTPDGDAVPANNTAYLNGATSTNAQLFTAPTITLANLYTTITPSAQTVASGTTVTLTVVVGNAGPGSASDVVESVQLLPGFTTGTLTVGGVTGTPSGTTITFGTGGPSYDTTTGVLTFPASTLASHGLQTYTVAFTAPDNAGSNGQLLLTASVASSTSDPVIDDNVAATRVTIKPAADVATTVSGPATATAGQAVTYAVSFANNGPSTATRVARTAQLPIGLTNVVVTDAATNTVVSGAYNATSGLVTLPTLSTALAGTQQLYTISFAAPGQSFGVSTSTSTTTPDGTPANNQASTSTTVSPVADVAVSISGPASAVLNNPVTYFVTTTNNGPSPATGVATTLQLPANLTGVTVSNGGTYSSSSGLVTFAPAGTLPSGASVADYATFSMPDAAGGQLTGVATTVSTSTDPVATNNQASQATSLASPMGTMADLVATVSAPASVTPGASLTVGATFTNNGPDAAASVQPVLQLPAGLSGVTVSNGGTYNATSGLVSWPTIGSLSSGAANALSYSVSFAAPANGPLTATSSVSSLTTDGIPANNLVTTSTTITANYDAATSLSGPVSSLPGVVNTYTVTAINNGPSTSPSTQQQVTLPAGVMASNISGGTQMGQVITWPAISNQAPGTGGEVSYTFSVAMPASGSLLLTATAAASGESNTTNNTASFATVAANQPPVASNVVNALQSPQANTAGQLPISPLLAADADGVVNTYTLTSIPVNAASATAGNPAQGDLYYNDDVDGVSGKFIQFTATNYSTIGLSPAQAQHLRFDPAANFVGNAFFTYTATDNLDGVSNVALYTIPVATDAPSVYTKTPAKGGVSSPYANTDILAYVIDPNRAQYNTNGELYNATGSNAGKLVDNTVNNGVVTTYSTGMFSSTSTPSRTTLASLGLAYNPATGEIYVQDRTKLLAGTYTVPMTTTDQFGGITTQPVTFTIGSNPLPVSLTSFTAQPITNRDARLDWTTASETNNDHFDIERSFDGVSFAKIGQLAGQGTKLTSTAYTLTDAGVAAKASGPVYYRLRQVDTNGTEAYSPVQAVRFTTTATASLGLYPNPATSATSLDLRQLPANGSYQVQLLDATGRTVRAWTLGGGQTQALDVSELATGVYHLLVTGQQPDGSALRQSLRLTKE